MFLPVGGTKRANYDNKQTSLHLEDCPDWARTPHPLGGSPVSLQLAAGIFNTIDLFCEQPETFMRTPAIECCATITHFMRESLKSIREMEAQGSGNLF